MYSHIHEMLINCDAVQRSCRRRKKSTRWSTTNSTLRSPNSLDSKRYCVVEISLDAPSSILLLFSTAPSPLLLSPVPTIHISLYTRFTYNENYCGAFTIRTASCLRIYFTQQSCFCMLYFVIILIEKDHLLFYFEVISHFQQSVRPYFVVVIALLRPAVLLYGILPQKCASWCILKELQISHRIKRISLCHNSHLNIRTTQATAVIRLLSANLPIAATSLAV